MSGGDDMISVMKRGLRARGEGEARHRASRREGSLLADRRGAVAFETILVYITLVPFVLMPIADLALAGLQFVSAWGALRSFGEYLQYNTPPDPTSISSWQSGLTTTKVSGYTMSNIAVMCGDANTACSSTNVSSIPKYYTYTTTVTLAPLVWKSVLCPTSCQYTLHYAERFQ
jgi:hypothetical protein